MTYATLRWDTMRVDGARFFAGQRFVVLREFTARGEDGDVQCLSLGNEAGEYLIPCVDRDDVDLEDK